jgi:AcrR family transcriptional regulator
VTLRQLTDAVEANVAAVSYHFGSLQSLCEAAVEHAVECYLDAQQEALNALGPESTLGQLAAAFARPMIRQLAAGGRDLAILRIAARAAIDPPLDWDRFDARFDGIRAAVLPVLKANVSGVKDEDLSLRARCMAAMLNWLPSRRSEPSSGIGPKGNSSDCWSRSLPAPLAAPAPADTERTARLNGRLGHGQPAAAGRTVVKTIQAAP